MKLKKSHPFSRKLPIVPQEVKLKANKIYQAVIKLEKDKEEYKGKLHYLARTEKMIPILDFYVRYESEWKYLYEKYKLYTLPQRHINRLENYYHFMIELKND